MIDQRRRNGFRELGGEPTGTDLITWIWKGGLPHDGTRSEAANRLHPARV